MADIETIKRNLLPAAKKGWKYLVTSAQDNAELKDTLVECREDYTAVLQLYDGFTHQVDHLSTHGDFGRCRSIIMKGFAKNGWKGPARWYARKLNRTTSRIKTRCSYLIEKIYDVIQKCKKVSQDAAQHSTNNQLWSWVSGCSFLGAIVVVLTAPVTATVTFVAGISFLSTLQFQENKSDFKELEKTFHLLYSFLQALRSRAITIQDKIDSIEEDSKNVIDTIDQGRFESDDLDPLRTSSRDLQLLNKQQILR